MTYSIYHDFEIKESIDKIFQAISEPEHLINWWPLKCTGIPKENEEYNFFFTSEYDWIGKVIKSKKNTAFHIKMTSADADWIQTSFGFDLKQLKNKVLVQFWHINWPELNEHFKTASFCWALLLNGLKEYVEQGKIVPFEERE